MLALALHFFCFLMGALEVWIALRFTGHPANFVQAIILESLTNALRSAAFPVPAALGVQEGGFVGFGYLARDNAGHRTGPFSCASCTGHRTGPARPFGLARAGNPAPDGHRPAALL